MWLNHSVYFNVESGRLLYYNAEADNCKGGGSAATDDITTEARKKGANGDAAADKSPVGQLRSCKTSV